MSVRWNLRQSLDLYSVLAPHSVSCRIRRHRGFPGVGVRAPERLDHVCHFAIAGWRPFRRRAEAN
jgi:hypothetical protein